MTRKHSIYLTLSYIMTRKTLLPLTIGFLSFCAISASYIMEYAFGMAPCTLCIYQRMIQISLLISSTVYGFIMQKRYHHTAQKIYERFIISVCVCSASLAIFHYGIETKLWHVESKCTNPAAYAKSFEDFQKMLEEADLVPCDIAGKKIMNIATPVEATLIYSLFTLCIAIYLSWYKALLKNLSIFNIK